MDNLWEFGCFAFQEHMVDSGPGAQRRSSTLPNKAFRWNLFVTLFEAHQSPTLDVMGMESDMSKRHAMRQWIRWSVAMFSPWAMGTQGILNHVETRSDKPKNGGLRLLTSFGWTRGRCLWTSPIAMRFWDDRLWGPLEPETDSLINQLLVSLAWSHVVQENIWEWGWQGEGTWNTIRYLVLL